MPNLVPYTAGGSSISQPQARFSALAPMNKAPVKLPPKIRPATSDESESDEDESESDDEAPMQRDLAKPSMRSDAVRSLSVKPCAAKAPTTPLLLKIRGSAASAPIPRPPIQPLPKLGPLTDDEDSEGEEDESENDDYASEYGHLVDSPTRSDSVQPPVLKGFVPPLDFSRFETRFLSIIPERSVELSCELRVESLIRTPEYVALSCHWGAQAATRRIFLNGHATKVTASLEAVLKGFRATGTRVAWVDALCINQPDNYETVFQLRLMGLIFSKATKVIAWLGPAANDSDNAMQALATMQFSDRNRLAITHLLQRPYWERAWIIQELARAAKVEVWCGTQVLPWDVFVQGTQRWWSYQRTRIGDFDHPIMVLHYFRKAEADVKKGTARMLLSVAMVRALDTKATLNRDKIYALLGLTRDGTDIVPTLNYEQDDATVFDTVLRHMIIVQGQLSLVFLAGIKRARGNSPSWLPRWNDTPSLERIPWLVRCFEQIDAKDNFVECLNNDTLKVTGQLLGRLQGNASASTSGNVAVSVAQATGLLGAIAWQLLKCRRNDHRLGSVPSVYDLASIWNSRSPSVWTRFSKLRKWYEDHADIGYANITPRASVAALSSNTQILLAERSILTSTRPNELHWLDHLEIAVSAMLHHQMSLRVMNHLGSPQMVMVPQSAKENHIVARFKGCALPVVLCGAGENRYNVIGEVVEVCGWFTSNSRNAAVPRYGDNSNALGRAFALGGDWQHIDWARWVTMYLV